MQFTFFIPYFMKPRNQHNIAYDTMVNNPPGGLDEPESIIIPESVKDSSSVVEQADKSAGDYKPENDPDINDDGNDYYGLAEDERNEMEENRGSE